VPLPVKKCGEDNMDVTDEALLSSGFTPSDLKKIKNNVESYGGTLGNAIRDLARRFILAVWVVSGCLAVFIFLVMFASEQSVFSGAIGLSCGAAVAIFIQPPVLAYKSWRFCRANKS
jgi:hypothetical protein